MMHLIDSAKGALKLCLLHMQHPSAVDAAQVQATANEAIERLNLVSNRHGLLQETYDAVRAVVPESIRVSVAPTPHAVDRVEAHLFDGKEMIRYLGKTPQGIAEQIRLIYSTEAA